MAAGSRNTRDGVSNPNETIVTVAEPGDADPCIAAMLQDTEESKKVSRMNGKKYYAVFRRKSEEEICGEPPHWIASLKTPYEDK